MKYRGCLAAFITVCFCNASSRGEAHYRLSVTPFNTQNPLFNTQGHALFISYKLTTKSILDFGEELMQKELVFCYSFFSQGTADS